MKMRYLRFIILLCFFVSCSKENYDEIPYLDIYSDFNEVEAGGNLPLSAYLSMPSLNGPVFLEWESDLGDIRKTRVENEVDFIAPSQPGTVIITVKNSEGTLSAEKKITILPRGSLNKTSRILIEVDTSTLSNLYVDDEAPSENFTPPLTIKGTFHYDPQSGAASAGGNWQNYLMYDDGSHGDEVKGDGIWSLGMEFEKSDEKVYFAFDDASEYRVQWESGVTWRLKSAWILLDDFPNDNSNPAFKADKDKTLRWDASMAEAADWGKQ